MIVDAPATHSMRMRPIRAYPAIGTLLGLGAPLGFLLLRYAVSRRERALPWLAKELRSNSLAYVYIGVSTPLVFGMFGRALGQREGRLRSSTRQVERLREEFAAIVAHDLRNPIQAILLQVQMLLRDAGDGSATVSESTLRKLQRSAERLADMVSDLLDATRIEASRLKLAPQPIDLEEAILDLIDRIRPTLGDHPIEVRAEPSPRVLADPTRLDQILTNLIDNAVKYSPDGAPILVRVFPAHRGVTISVEDRGSGIAASELPRLFDRFYQAKRARAKRGGLGLGLYITKGLVEAHEGIIRVESEPDHGSRFSVWLPSG